ncbi:MAG: hypothetical protein ACLP0J_27645 [Solirubrobacteraceae bacterium]
MPLLPQRSHAYVKDVGALDHAPLLVVSVLPSRALPVRTGAALIAAVAPAA